MRLFVNDTSCKRGFTLNLSIHIWGIFALILSVSFLHSDPGKEQYIVQEGDSLYEIAIEYGVYWNRIYELNKDKIANPDLIFPGQVLLISVEKEESKKESQDKAPQDLSDLSKEPNSPAAVPDSQKAMLDEFRKVFDKLIEEEENERTAHKKQLEEERNQYANLSLSGLVLDETMSKMGRNFYDVFYQQWKKPKGAQNATITIQEQPIPSRGTMVIVEIDNEPVFKHRLEPRYYKTEEAAKYAVQICQQRVLYQASLREDEFIGY